MLVKDKSKFMKRISHYSTNPGDLAYLFQFKSKLKDYRPSDLSLMELSQKLSEDDKAYCYEALKKVSRSFAIVIQQLPEELKDAICIFYLVLRGLDTIEDDMNIPLEEKHALLAKFHEMIEDPNLTIKAYGDTQDYQDLMANFNRVNKVYLALGDDFRKTIKDITEEMAEGMMKYGEQEIITFKDWDHYCYYVAGIVGKGLTQLFLNANITHSLNEHSEAWSIDMGLFLQKTNIIRDYHEDLLEGRVFWPECAWNNKVSDIADLQKDLKKGKAALNELVLNALEHIPNCIAYLNQIQENNTLRFCAIPQLMAIATLVEVYNNEEVFFKNVKIRRGVTAKYIMEDWSHNKVKAIFVKHLQQLRGKVVTTEERFKIDGILGRLS